MFRLFSKKIVVISCILFINGCGSHLLIHTMKHGDQTRHRLAGDTTLINPKNIIDMSLSLDVERVRDDKNQATYYLQLSYIDNNYIYIQKGKSLILSLDQSEKLVFKGEGSKNYRKQMDYGEKKKVIERAGYEITPEKIHKISLAQEVEVEIKGRDTTLFRKFSPTTLKKYQEFIKQYYKP